MWKWLAVLSLLILTVVGLFAGPTWLAHRLAGGTDPARTVAPPVAEVAGVPLYFITSVEQFGPRLKDAPGTAAIGFAMTFAGPAIGFGVVLLAQLYSQPKPREVGREKWMTLAQAKRAGLTAGRGVVVGQLGRGRWRKLLTFDGPEHQIVTGASRSGKGVGHVVPTLLSWHRSALVYDVKAELWEATSRLEEPFLTLHPVQPDRPKERQIQPTSGSAAGRLRGPRRAEHRRDARRRRQRPAT